MKKVHPLVLMLLIWVARRIQIVVWPAEPAIDAILHLLVLGKLLLVAIYWLFLYRPSQKSPTPHPQEDR